jgi:hypothetical protein
MDRTVVSAMPKGDATMPANWRYIALHALAAGTFIFLVQRFTLSATLEASMLWAVAFGGCAAGLAYMQSNR